MLGSCSGIRVADGRAGVVRNGYHPKRDIVTGIGSVTVRIPKVPAGWGCRWRFARRWFRRMFGAADRWTRRFHGCTSRGLRRGRSLVKRVLRKHGYPPDKQEKATRTVLEQAEVLSEGWAT